MGVQGQIWGVLGAGGWGPWGSEDGVEEPYGAEDVGWGALEDEGWGA